jgi:hypothetical protein
LTETEFNIRIVSPDDDLHNLPKYAY